MSTGNANTPNGVGNDLYIKNEDLGKQQLAVIDMSEKDPSKDLTGNVPGDNTIIEESKLIDYTTAIRDFGDVKIAVGLVGQPMRKDDPETNGKIKASIEEVKRILMARGAMSEKDYIEAKKARAEKGKEKEEEQEEQTLENDDRNQ